MAKYGAKAIKWAPESTNGYGATVDLGKLVKVTDTPKFSEGKLYADNSLAEYVNEFTEADVNVEVSDIPTASAVSIFGATSATESGGTAITYGSEDSAPYGGLGFICCKLVNGVKSYVGIFYPRVKATLEGEEYETKGDTVTFATGKLKFKAVANAANAWKQESAALDSETAAIAWVTGKFTAK